MNSDWPEEIFKLENLNLKPFEVQKLWSQATQKLNMVTATIFVTGQEEWNTTNCNIKVLQNKTWNKSGLKKLWSI